MIHVFADEDNYYFSEELVDSVHDAGIPSALYPIGYTIPSIPAGEVVHFIGSYYLDWILDALSSYQENLVVWSPSLSNYRYKADAAMDYLGVGFATVNEWRQAEIHKINQILGKINYLWCFSSQELGFLHGLGEIPSSILPSFAFTPLVKSYVKIPEPPLERIVFYDNGKVDNGIDLFLRKNGILDLLKITELEVLVVRRKREYWDDYDGLYQEKLSAEIETQKRFPLTVLTVETEEKALSLIYTGKTFVDLSSWISNPSFHLACFAGGRSLVATPYGCLTEYLGTEVHYIPAWNKEVAASQIIRAWTDSYCHPQNLEALNLTQQLHLEQLKIWRNFYQAIGKETNHVP